MTHKNTVGNVKGGGGLVNWFIDKLPVELHIPTYRYCGPGTKLEKKLQNNIPGKNLLDEACKTHDIAYSKVKTVEERNKADELLENSAWNRVTSNNANFGEKAAAWTVTNIMKLKRKIGAGVKSSKKRIRGSRFKKHGSGLTFNQFVKKIKPKKNKKTKNVLNSIKQTLLAAKKFNKTNISLPKNRIIPIPISGGAIPIVPILSALNHIGTLVGGVSTIVDAVHKINEIRKQVKNNNSSTHQEKIGRGISITRRKKGLALLLN